jgi:hypothetical protein
VLERPLRNDGHRELLGIEHLVGIERLLEQLVQRQQRELLVSELGERLLG